MTVTAAIQLTAHLGYLVLFALIGAESAGVPLPGETALITTGVLARSDQLDIGLVIVVAAVAAIAGDNVGYLIGRVGGRRLLERPGFLQDHRRDVLRKGEPFFAKHGPKAVFLVGLLAFFLGPTAEKIFKYVGVGGIAVVAVGVLAFLVWRHLRRGSDVAGAH